MDKTKQVGGTHYNMAISPIEYIQANKLSFEVGSIVKYVSRYKQKDGLKDLLKAKQYIDFIIENEYPEHKIKKGDKFRCKQDYSEKKDSAEYVKYFKDAIYTSVLDDTITDEMYLNIKWGDDWCIFFEKMIR